MTFSDLHIVEPIMKALSTKGYTHPTPIQEKAIPYVLKGQDVLGVAQTGTGKTAAFAIPIIQRLLENGDQNDRSIKALIVTPTRELAIQIDENIKAYSSNTNLKHTVIFGGVKQFKQVERLKKGVDILTATPGRLLDLINQGYINIDLLKIFILDEADRMLDMGFINDIRKLIAIIPPKEKRQSLFFSATMPSNIIELSNTILNKPQKVEVTPASSTAETIQQYVYYTNRTDKRKLLFEILKERSIEQALVFTRTKHGADRVARDLTKKGISASSIHGDKAQNQRQKSLKNFKEGKTRVLVATDIAARGIDIDKLKYVINYEVPNLPETYVHRIGRSGRAGEEGIAIAISEPEENAFVRDIEKLTGQKLTVVVSENFPQTDKPMTPAEKKEWEKEKQRRKQEFFANRKAARNKKQGGGNQEKGKKKGNRRSEKTDQNNSENKKTEGRSKPNRRSNPQKDNNQNPKNEGPKENSPNENRPKKKKKQNKGGRRYKSTDASAKLKSKFMWPLD